MYIYTKNTNDFRAWILFLIVSFLLGAAGLRAQTSIDELRREAPRVFIDCSTCDKDFIRTEITFVNYVRDRKEADVHLLVSIQRTGSGGDEYTLTFIGQNGFAGVDDVHKYYTNESDSSDQVRRGLVQALKQGLLRYAARTPIAGRIQVGFREEAVQAAKTDKWRNWLFSISTSGFFSGQSSYGSASLNASITANRVTDLWKIRLNANLSESRDRYTFEGTDIISTSQSRTLQGMVVRSIGAHWSVGGYASASTSSYSNIDLGLNFAPAVEYNLFPYAQSARRQLRFLYRFNIQPTRYREETIFDKTREMLLEEELAVTLALKEKWGTVSTTLEGSHYFHDFSKNRLDLSASLSLNLVKGLSLDLYGSGAMVHNQLFLAKAGATLDEVLLQRRQLATTYNYYFSVGFSYTFGSIFTNIINPRFGGSGNYISISM